MLFVIFLLIVSFSLWLHSYLRVSSNLRLKIVYLKILYIYKILLNQDPAKIVSTYSFVSLYIIQNTEYITNKKDIDDYPRISNSNRVSGYSGIISPNKYIMSDTQFLKRSLNLINFFNNLIVFRRSKSTKNTIRFLHLFMQKSNSF